MNLAEVSSFQCLLKLITERNISACVSKERSLVLKMNLIILYMGFEITINEVNDFGLRDSKFEAYKL